MKQDKKSILTPLTITTLTTSKGAQTKQTNKQQTNHYLDYNWTSKGLKMTENIWDNVRTQLNIIYNIAPAIFRRFNVEELQIKPLPFLLVS